VLTAWADESGSRPDLDPGIYLLTAALCEDDDVAEIRKTLEALRIGEPKLHWHGSSDERRADLVNVLSELPVTGFVVIHLFCIYSACHQLCRNGFRISNG
jgi:hypothetical protein